MVPKKLAGLKRAAAKTMKVITEASEERKMANEELVLLDIVIEPGVKGVEVYVQSDMLEEFFATLARGRKYKLTSPDGKEVEFYQVNNLEFLTDVGDGESHFFVSPQGGGKDYLEIDGRFNFLPLLQVGISQGVSFTYGPCGSASRKRFQDELRLVVEYVARNILYPPTHKMRITVEKTSAAKAA